MEQAPWGTIQDELDWCIQVLQKKLLETGSDPLQGDESQRVLLLLQSDSVPFVNKRQAMQRMFGDYRERMTVEHKGKEAQEQTEDVPQSESEAHTDTSRRTGLGEGFAFNFQIPPQTHPTGPSEDISTVGPANAEDQNKEDLHIHKQGKAKKKKSNKKTPVTHAATADTCSAEDNLAGPTESPEQQLSRELDWCIEQLELGMRTQKSTPRQMEEASRALKTLRSSKAPLVKKRQVMRAMFGDYRKKMEEEKAKQARLIMAAVKSAHVTPVSKPSKKSVFHRKAESRLQQQPKQQDKPSNEESTGTNGAKFVFIPSQEEFCFNFF